MERTSFICSKVRKRSGFGVALKLPRMTSPGSPECTGKPRNFHLGRPPSSTDTLLWPNACEGRRCVCVCVCVCVCEGVIGVFKLVPRSCSVMTSYNGRGLP